ncbi:hypothetical protein SEA_SCOOBYDOOBYDOO_30 [Mycobacterium phage ScoobyDoobyDoo]|nr:hypothetical protein SEA_SCOOBYDOOBYDOO_30 [Mycobacterium phage ScoobyDoobyDoo]
MSAPENKVSQAVDAWYATAEKWYKYGSSDTEPRAIFAEMFEVAINDGPANTEIPKTVSDWSLYSEMRGAGLAASALTKAARKVVDAVAQDREGAGEVFAWRFGYTPWGLM